MSVLAAIGGLGVMGAFVLMVALLTEPPQ